MADVVVAKVEEWAVEACSEPVFMIRVDRGEGREPVHYLVLAHWEYDPEKADTEEQQRDDCDAIATEFGTLAPIGAEARIVPSTWLTGLFVTRRPCTTCPPRRQSVPPASNG